MVNSCVAFGCSGGYHTNREKVSTFSFPHGKSDQENFFNRNDWLPTKTSVLCTKHFDEKFILKGKWNKLNRDLHRIPKIHSEKNKKASLLPTTTELRKPRKLWWIIHQPDELQDFISIDMIKDFNHLEEEKFCLNSFEYKTEDYILIYGIVFDPGIHCPSLKECIRINQNLHVQLQCDGNPIPLPLWFIHIQC